MGGYSDGIYLNTFRDQSRPDRVGIYIFGDGHINWYQVVRRHTSLYFWWAGYTK